MSPLVALLVSFAIVSASMLALGLGLVFGRQPIRGSCGGLNNPGGCALCTRTCRRQRSDSGGRAAAPPETDGTGPGD